MVEIKETMLKSSPDKLAYLEAAVVQQAKQLSRICNIIATIYWLELAILTIKKQRKLQFSPFLSVAFRVLCHFEPKVKVKLA